MQIVRLTGQELTAAQPSGLCTGVQLLVKAVITDFGGEYICA